MERGFDAEGTQLIVILYTQISITLGVALILKGPFLAYFIQFPIEIVILIAETILYRRFLKGKSNGRKCVYGVVANIASWAVGFFLLSYQYQVLTALL